VNESKKQFAEQLLACEESPSKASENYEKELRAMFDNKLSPKQRREWLICAACWPPLAGGLCYVAFKLFRQHSPEFQWSAYVGVYMILTAAALLGISAVLGFGVWRGGYERHLDRKILGGLAIVYVGLTGWVFMLASRHAPDMFRNDLFVFGLVLLLYTATAWIRQRVGQSELKTREKLLEIELRVARIAEAVGHIKGTGPINTPSA
jgi:hypothetical protein